MPNLRTLPLLSTLTLVPCAALAAATPTAAPAPDDDSAVAVRLDTVVVTGSRTETRLRDATTPVELIDRQAIEQSGAENLAEALEAHPGVAVERTFRGYTVRLQGLDPKYVLVLVDGERTLGRVGGALDLTRLPISAVERIEIVKGAGATLYGSDAVAGVINVITRGAQERFAGGGHVSGGTRGAMDVAYHLGARRERWDVMAIAGHHRSAAWDLTPATPGTTAGAARSSDANLRATWRPSAGFALESRAEWVRREQEGVTDTATGALLDQTIRSEQASAALTPEWRWAGGSRLRLAGHYGFFDDQFRLDQRGGDALDQLQKAREHLGKLGLQHDARLTPAQQLTTGAEVLHERMTSDRLGAGNHDRTRAALFAQHEWRVLGQRRLVLLPGLRLDSDTQFGVHLSPKLAARFDPHERVAVRVSYGAGYRAPGFSELYLAFSNPAAGYTVAGNTALRPERAHSLQASVDWRPLEDHLELSLGVFRNDLRDLITTALGEAGLPGSGARYSYVNVDRASTQGLETSAAAQLPIGVRAELSYTFTSARDLSGGRPLEGQARHRGTFALGYQHRGAGFAAKARGTLVGTRPFYGAAAGPAGEVAAEGYATVGLRLAQRVWRKTDLFAGGDNLLDAGDERFAPILPRTFYLGLDFGY